MNRIWPARRFDGTRYKQAMAKVFVGLEAHQATTFVPRRKCQIRNRLLQLRRLHESSFGKPALAALRALAHIEQTLDSVIQ